MHDDCYIVKVHVPLFVIWKYTVLSVRSLKNVQRFNNRGDTLQWAASVSLSPRDVQAVKDQSIQEIVSKSVTTQVCPEKS